MKTVTKVVLISAISVIILLFGVFAVAFLRMMESDAFTKRHWTCTAGKKQR